MDKDLKEMFKEKNRVILVSNLKYDLSKNIDSMLDTITNIFNLEFDTAIKNIVSILKDSCIVDANKFVTESVNKMKLESYNKIEELLSIKRDTLDSQVDNLEFEEESLNEYYETVFQTTKNFKDEFKNFSVLNIQKKGFESLNQFILDNVDSEREELTISRVSDYLENRLYGKLETKIRMELMLRDNNLINKAKESYLRFQAITSKTIKN